MESGAAMLLYSKKGIVQNLIYNLKYKGHYSVGTTIGKIYGYKLKKAPLFNDVDLIVPVPLHWKKRTISRLQSKYSLRRRAFRNLRNPFIKRWVKKVDGSYQ